MVKHRYVKLDRYVTFAFLGFRSISLNDFFACVWREFLCNFAALSGYVLLDNDARSEDRCSKTQQTRSTSRKRNSRWNLNKTHQHRNQTRSHLRNAAKLKRSPHQTNATEQCHVIETKFASKPGECRCLLWFLFGSRKRHPSSKHMLVPFRVFSRGLRKRDSRWVLLCCGAFFCNAASYKHRGCVALNHIRMYLKRAGRTGLKPFPKDSKTLKNSKPKSIKTIFKCFITLFESRLRYPTDRPTNHTGGPHAI